MPIMNEKSFQQAPVSSTERSAGPQPMQPDLRFARDGKWYQGEEPVTHQGIAQFFSRHLRYDEAHRCFVVERNGYAVRVVVEDAPFIAVSVDPRQRPWKVELHEGTVEEISPQAIYVGPDDALYLEVRSGTVRARLSPAAAEQLFPFIEERNGRFELRCDGETVPFLHTEMPVGGRST